MLAIGGDLVRSDGEWENWDLDKLAEALRLWIRRNAVVVGRDDEQTNKRLVRERMFLTNKGDKPRGCLDCESREHKGVDGHKVTTSAVRKKSWHKMFQLRYWHPPSRKMTKKSLCQICHKRHHMSIRDK